MSGEQDMFKMGGLRKKMKITMVTFFIASLTIAGVPPLAAFFSKDEILWLTFNSLVGPSWLPGLLWGLLFVGAGITAFYVFRAVFLTFFGKPRYTDEVEHHVHESPAIMTVPLIILAAGSIVAGFIGVPAILGGVNHFHHFLEPALGPVSHDLAAAAMEHATPAADHGGETPGSHTLELILMALSVLVGLIGIGVAYRFYLQAPLIPARLTQSFKGVYNLVYNKYFVDEAYEAMVVKPGFRLSETLLFKVIDVWIIDGTVNAIGAIARLLGSTVRLLQTGVVRTYAFFFLMGILFLVYKLAR
jgi:NADH-quinone oxidoreductase subunit L